MEGDFVLHHANRGSSIDAEGRMRAGVNPQPEEACIQSTVTASVDRVGRNQQATSQPKQCHTHSQTHVCVLMTAKTTTQAMTNRRKTSTDLNARQGQHAGATYGMMYRGYWRV
jgi:hypothetical protein